jgi:hypothetical protein
MGGLFFIMDLDNYNAEVKLWADNLIAAMRTTAAGMGMQHRPGSPSPGPSLQKFTAREYYDHGAVNRIGIRLPRTLIYPHKGAGKGYGGNKGSTWADKYGEKKTTDPDSLGKMGTGNRKAKPFFNDTLNGPDGTEALGDIAARNLAIAITDHILIK